MYKLAFLFPLKVLKALKTPYLKPARGGLAITNTPAFKRVVLASFVPLMVQSHILVRSAR